MRLIDAEQMTTRLAAKVQEKKDSVVPMARLEAAIDDYICEEIRMAPTVDPVKHGWWIDINSRDRIKCSECGGERSMWNFGKSEFCPQCGAKMR